MDRAPFACTNSGRFTTAQNWCLQSDFGQASRQLTSTPHRETCADFAGVLQRPVSLICQVQRPQRPLAFAGIAEADDDEFLTTGTFDLQPTPLTSGNVWCVGFLGDNPSESRFGGLCEHLRTLTSYVAAITKRFVVLKNSLQPFLTLFQSFLGKISAIDIQEIEKHTRQ
jgi:hypothetical protein